MRRNIILTTLLALLMLLSGCATLFGRVDTVDHKSDSYGVLNLAQKDPDWARLPTPAEDAKDADAKATEVSDVAFQSKKTASIISLNSACRPRDQEPAEYDDLKKFTDLLFLGISDITLREEKNLTIQSIAALQTTLQGKLNGEDTKLRTIVLRRGDCIYDLMYVARPDRFSLQEANFDQFVASLRLK